MIRPAVIALAALSIAPSARSAVVYQNKFDTENGGITRFNYDAPAGLYVADGSIDLVHTGDGNGIVCAGGSGGCLDLDGSTNRAGLLYSIGDFSFVAGHKVTLTYSISGDQRAGHGTDGYSLGFGFEQDTSGTFVFSTSTDGIKDHGPFTADPSTGIGVGNAHVPFDKPFTDVTLSFRPDVAGLYYLFISGYSGATGDSDDDSVGMILDNLKVTDSVPEPASWAMLVGGFGLVGGAVRRRRVGRLA